MRPFKPSSLNGLHGPGERLTVTLEDLTAWLRDVRAWNGRILAGPGHELRGNRQLHRMARELDARLLEGWGLLERSNGLVSQVQERTSIADEEPSDAATD